MAAARRAYLGFVLMMTLAGCHGGAQTDIVERELRSQEDQIYAMEDYLGQYQQLLCQYRSENAALKRQLARRRWPSTTRDRDESPQRRSRDQTPRGDLRRPRVPPLDRTMPKLDNPSSDSGARQPVEDAPDLEFRSARRRTAASVQRAILEQPSEPTEPIVPVAEPVIKTVVAERSEPLQHVALHGDVLPDDGQSGPRLLVDVELLAASGRPAAFEGELSLMVLDASDRQPRGIARWDFSPEDLAHLIDQEAGEPMQFPLQLPAETPIDRPIQLWVRLVPVGGEKLLTHAELDLQQAGQFASARTRPLLAEQAEAVTNEKSIEERLASTDETNMSIGAWDGWKVARPGRPVTVAARDGLADSQWRKATQPMPEVMNQGRSVPTRKRAASKKADKPITRVSLPPERQADKAEPPSWSPERGTDSRPTSSDVPSPVWSPER